MLKRIGGVLAAAGLSVSTVVLGAPQAEAGAFDGDVTNRLPSSYTVKIATFGGGSERCAVDGGATYNCTTYWLPSGQSDDQIRGRNWDADGVMVEQSYKVERWGGTSSHWVSGFTWTKFSSVENATCFYDGAPICEIE